MEDVHRRTAFLSDAHLGTPGCQAELRLDFLRHLHCRQLYLVGDIIDLGALQRHPWRQASHSHAELQRLARASAGLSAASADRQASRPDPSRISCPLP